MLVQMEPRFSTPPVPSSCVQLPAVHLPARSMTGLLPLNSSPVFDFGFQRKRELKPLE
jgi:hypothetical protein